VAVARTPHVLRAPAGNHFPTRQELRALLAGTGFELLEQIDRSDDLPLSWSQRIEQVATIVAARHRADPAYELAARQNERFTRLLASGQISMRLIHAVRRPTCHTFPNRTWSEDEPLDRR
jgi:hypothetical protein